MPIFEILHKYDGERVHDDIKLGRRRYKFLRLPKFLAMHMKRFAKNNFYVCAPLLFLLDFVHSDAIWAADGAVSRSAASLIQTANCTALMACDRRWRRTRRLSTSP